LAHAPNGLALFKIAEQVGLHSPTAYHILATLLSHDLVFQDPKTKIYRLGSNLIRIGEFARTQNDIVSVAMDNLYSLANEAGELVNLAILQNQQAVYIAQAQGHPRSVVGLFTQIGAQVPLYSTGVGKAILANMSDDFFEQIVKKGLVAFTPNTITNETKLREEMDLIHRRGFAIDHEENSEGVCCVASPIWNGVGKVVGAISISGPSARINSSNFSTLGQFVCENARLISQKMGYVF
jgi:DNA-binding IclR family transcriptional regulator